jgi:hypothetical protein
MLEAIDIGGELRILVSHYPGVAHFPVSNST